jgi:hypothetical protein
MTTQIIKRVRSTWVLFIATILLSGLFAFANLSEFVTVGVLKKTSGYPFGGEGPTPWFYESAQLYATVNLIFGVLFLISFSVGTWSFVRLHRKALLISFGLSMICIILKLLAGQPD